VYVSGGGSLLPGSLTPEADARLQQVGARVCVWPKGAIVAASAGAWRKASAGAWRKAQVRSVRSKQTCTPWANAQTAGWEEHHAFASGRSGPDVCFRSAQTAAVSRVGSQGAAELRDAFQAIPLTRDGTVPLDSTCPAFRGATLGTAGSCLTHTGVVVSNPYIAPLRHVPLSLRGAVRQWPRCATEPQRGVAVVATDGSVKDDGRMGAA
jgi:hypothetical protein